jgi:hypothetical protein
MAHNETFNLFKKANVKASLSLFLLMFLLSAFPGFDFQQSPSITNKLKEDFNKFRVSYRPSMNHKIIKLLIFGSPQRPLDEFAFINVILATVSQKAFCVLEMRSQ